MSKNSNLFINVGGAGPLSTSKNSDYTGGYNGGGNSYHWVYNDQYSAAGGGATHISTVAGLLSELESYKGAHIDNRYYVSEYILIVGGAGGGAVENAYNPSVWAGNHGAEAGGISGNSATSRYPSADDTYMSGGTQVQGGKVIYKNTSRGIPDEGSFGKGGNSSKVASASGGSGGGAGWYGGGGSTTVATGSGGSSYVGSLNLISGGGITKHMTCYSCTTSTDSETRTYSNTTVPTTTPTADVARIGNGYAKITYLGTSI